MEVRKILIVRTSALGDVVHVLPALTALRDLYPRAFIAWLIEPVGADLLRDHPLIDQLLVFDRPRWKREWRRPASWPHLLSNLFGLLRQARAHKFDLVIDFQCNVRSGLAVLLSGGQKRLGFCRVDSPEWGGYLFTNQKCPPCPRPIHKVEKNMMLVRALGWEGGVPSPVLAVPGDHMTWAREMVATLPGSGPVITIHPAVSRFGEFKRWPVDHFRGLIDLLQDELDARVLITWGPGEKDIAQSIGRPTVAPPIDTTLHLAAVCAASDLVLAADTGMLHIAAALGTRTVGLYGPKDVRVYSAYPPSPRTRTVRSGVPCSPCTLRRCEHRICMSMIFPGDVLGEIKEALASADTAGQII